MDELGDPSATTEVIQCIYIPDPLGLLLTSLTDYKEDVVVVGRICADADATSILSKLTEGSIFIESSRMQGSGARVPLRFSPTLKLRGTVQGAGAIGLFPGAIAALKGKNGGGGLFVVNEILGVSIPMMKLQYKVMAYISFFSYHPFRRQWNHQVTKPSRWQSLAVHIVMTQT